MDFIQYVVTFFNQVYDFLGQGIYQFASDAFAQFVIWATIQQIEFKIWIVGFAWEVAKSILDQLNISDALASAYGAVNGDVASMLGFFNIPEAINIILSALVTKFVLRFMGL